MKKTVLCLSFFIFFFFGSAPSSVWSQNADLNFYSFQDNIEFLDKTKSRDENIKNIEGILNPASKSAAPDDSFTARIPFSVAKKYVLPAPGSRLYLFLGSKYIGETEPINFMLVPGTANLEDAVFVIDLKRLQLSKSELEDVMYSGILVSGSGKSELRGIGDPSGVKNASDIEKLSPDKTKELMKRGMEKLGKGSDGCSDFAEYKVLETFHFKNDSMDVVVMKSPKMCGENQPTLTIVNDGKLVGVFRDDSMRRVTFSQYFKIDGRKFIVLNKHEDLADINAVYELKTDGAVLLKEFQ